MLIGHEDSRTAPPTALDAAIEAVERSICADGSDARFRDEGERPGLEWRALKQWCVENHRVLGEEIAPERIGGREHDVRFDQATRQWIKFTKWDCAGYSVDLETGQPVFLPATPLQYLRRLRLHNATFGDRVVFLGLQQQGYMLRIVTGQPDIVGEAPSLQEMDRSLCELHSFTRLAIPPMGYHGSRSYLRENVALFDAHPANCVMTPEGIFVPIDFILMEVDAGSQQILLGRAGAEGK